MSLPITSTLPEKPTRVTCTSPANSIARAWLQECLDQHELCGDGKIPKLPHRVIHVSDELLRLEEPENKHAHYATLSYSIGGAHLFTTTSDNLRQRMDEFSVTDLPKTAQDAVWWTKQLGLEYLWLDSLCILQDNIGDWEIEVSSIAEIYSGATVTVAATRAETAAEGCRPCMNKLNMLPCQPIPGVVVLPDYRRATWIFQRGFLDSRAWCFQEVELYKRVLRVGGEELAWQCRKCKRLESNPSEQKGHDIEALVPFFGSRALDATFEREERPFKLWYSLAKSFGRRNLTFPADRLPAFSGMAQRFQNILRATYLAGIWKEDIYRGLVWDMSFPGRDVAYRAPTWSWVSVEGGLLTWAVRFYNVPSEEFVVELLDVWVRVSGHNPYGRVTAGKLTISRKIASIPPFLFEDDSEIGAVDWRQHLRRWDRGLPGIGSCFLRLHESACVVLEPVAGKIGT